LALPVMGKARAGAARKPNLGSICEGDDKEVVFDEGVEELEAASVVAAGRARPTKERVATGVAAIRGRPADEGAAGGEAEEEDEDDNGVEFDDNVEEVEAASAAVVGKARPLKTRVATGAAAMLRARELDEESPDDGIGFDDAVEECQAASVIADGAARPAKGRVATGHVRAEEEPSDDVRFSDQVASFPAASECGHGRPVKNRIATGYGDRANGDNQRTLGSATSPPGPLAGSSLPEMSRPGSDDQEFVAELLRKIATNTATAHELRRGCSYAAQLGPAGARFLPHLEALAESSSQGIAVRTTAKDAIKVIRARMKQEGRACSGSVAEPVRGAGCRGAAPPAVAVEVNAEPAQDCTVC